jgi:hypothetical protein
MKIDLGFGNVPSDLQWFDCSINNFHVCWGQQKIQVSTAGGIE